MSYQQTPEEIASLMLTEDEGWDTGHQNSQAYDQVIELYKQLVQSHKAAADAAVAIRKIAGTPNNGLSPAVQQELQRAAEATLRGFAGIKDTLKQVHPDQAINRAMGNQQGQQGQQGQAPQTPPAPQQNQQTPPQPLPPAAPRPTMASMGYTGREPGSRLASKTPKLQPPPIPANNPPAPGQPNQSIPLPPLNQQNQRQKPNLIQQLLNRRSPQRG